MRIQLPSQGRSLDAGLRIAPALWVAGANGPVQPTTSTRFQTSGVAPSSFVLRRSSFWPPARHGAKPNAAPTPSLLPLGAFSLLEVMIAILVFFLVSFSVLEVISVGLGAARSLQIQHPDAGILAAHLSLTNRLEESSDAGDFDDIEPGVYPDCRWERNVFEASSNGLWQVDFLVIEKVGRRQVPSTMSILMYRPGGGRGAGPRPVMPGMP